jgi:diguanylate cyclase
VYAAITLVPVTLLGLGLAANYRHEAEQRGLFVGKSEARLVAETAIEPLLDGRPLADGLTPGQVDGLKRLVMHAVRGHNVVRLRLRGLSGRVVFSDDGSGFGDKPEDEALDAAQGENVVRLTHLNSDSDDSGDAGPQSVEVYLPLMAGTPVTRVGVLEIYLPYAPINADVSAELHTLYLGLGLGLAALYIVLFALSFSISRGLRRQVKLNKFLAEHDPLTSLPNRALFRRGPRRRFLSLRPSVSERSSPSSTWIASRRSTTLSAITTATPC